MLFPYLQYIEECNSFVIGETEYYLYPGMEFGSREKWWPDSGLRPTRHEGIDLCYYEVETGKECAFSPKTLVPVMASGRIVAICRDFLGYSLFLDHEYEQRLRFCSIYAHIIPFDLLAVGKRLSAGQTIGTVADTTGRKNRMPAHLHLSLMRVDKHIAPENFDWNLMHGSQVDLLDPLKMVASERIHFPSRRKFRS